MNSGYNDQRNFQGQRGGYSNQPHREYGNRWDNTPPPRPEPPRQTGVPGEPHVVFKNKYYSLAMLKNIAPTGAKITINKGQLHPQQNTLVDVSAALSAQSYKPVVVCQHEGRLVVLLGQQMLHEQADDATIRANLLSNIVLKKAMLWDVA